MGTLDHTFLFVGWPAFTREGHPGRGNTFHLPLWMAEPQLWPSRVSAATATPAKTGQAPATAPCIYTSIPPWSGHVLHHDHTLHFGHLGRSRPHYGHDLTTSQTQHCHSHTPQQTTSSTVVTTADHVYTMAMPFPQPRLLL